MQQFMVKDIIEHYAKEILNWQYESPYDFYNLNANTNSIKEFLENEYYVVMDTCSKGDLVGFYCIGESAQVPSGAQIGAYPDGYIDIGIGMKPDLTGKGNGTIFFSFILNQILINPDLPLRLTVAKFNHRAIHLYEKFGFVRTAEFKNSSTRFITMVKK